MRKKNKNPEVSENLEVSENTEISENTEVSENPEVGKKSIKERMNKSKRKLSRILGISILMVVALIVILGIFYVTTLASTSTKYVISSIIPFKQEKSLDLLDSSYLGTDEWEEQLQLPEGKIDEFYSFLIEIGEYENFKENDTFENALLILDRVKKEYHPISGTTHKNFFVFVSGCKFHNDIKEQLLKTSNTKTVESDLTEE